MTSFGEYFDNQRIRLEKMMQNKNTELNKAWREDFDKRQEKKNIDNNVENVCKALKEREKKGLKKYGVTTERTDLTTLDWIQHLQEELMDACVYLETLKKEF